jgi:hypothetical protein
MARTPKPRVSDRLLEDKITAGWGPRFRSVSAGGWKYEDVAAVLGVSLDAVKKIAERGSLSVEQADRFAALAGFHPAEIWSEWWSLVGPVAPEPDPEVVRREKERAYQREWKRRKRASDPEYAERQREYRRRYYQECGAYERARERAKYWADPEPVRERNRQRRAS